MAMNSQIPDTRAALDAVNDHIQGMEGVTQQQDIPVQLTLQDYHDHIPLVHEGYMPERMQSFTPQLSSPQDRLHLTQSKATADEGGPGGWNRGRKMPPILPSQEFSNTHNEAVAAYVAQDYALAIDLCREAISLNPEVYATHSLLAQLFELVGEEENAIDALFLGAHAASRNPEAWNNAAQALLQTDKLERTEALKQAGQCYTRLVDINSEDQEARFKRASVYRELGSYGRSLADLERILEHQPHNPSVLRGLAETCVESDRVHLAKKKYEEFISYSKYAHEVTEEIFTWSDLNVYVELFAHCKEFDEAIFNLKQLSRWLLGRADESYWDRIDNDDREWDAEDAPRRNEVPSFRSDVYPAMSYGDGLPLELRVKLGIYRLRQGRDSRAEAFQHFEWLEPGDDEADAKFHDYSDLFLEVGLALRSVKEHDEALRYLQPLKAINRLPSSKAWLAIGECLYVCENKDEAVECYEIVKVLDSENAEARTQLSKLYADLGDKEQAIRNGEEAVILRHKAIKISHRRRYERKDQRLAREAAEKALRAARKLPSGMSRFRHYKPPERVMDFEFTAAQTEWQLDFGQIGEIGHIDQINLNQPRPKPRKFKRKDVRQTTKEEREARANEKVSNAFEDLQAHTEGMRAGDPYSTRRWLQAADTMITDFRTNRILYPYDRHKKFKGFKEEEENRTQGFRKKWHNDKLKQVSDNPFSIPNTPTPDPNTDTNSPPGSADIPIPSIEPLPNAVATTYRTIPFTIWLDIFLEYALHAAKTSSQHTCYTTITAALDCIVFYHSAPSMLRIYTIYFLCCLLLKDGATLFNTCARWFMRQYQFSTDTYRLFACLNLHLDYPAIPGGKDAQMLTAAFRLGPSQKFMMRQIKAVDALLPADYDGSESGPVPNFMRDELPRITLEDFEDVTKRAAGGFPGFDERDIKVEEMDVVLLTLYGHILYAAGSYPNALSYFYRAYTLDPRNPVVLLSISLSYAHQMFKRQNDDRHFWLLRGLAFFEEYASVRTELAKEQGKDMDFRGEIEFNRARVWQMLGMGDLAVRGYERALPSREGREWKEDEDQGGEFEREAAYALQVIYGINGDMEMAREVTERWLVVE